MTSAAMAIDDVERLQARLDALEQERKHLLAVHRDPPGHRRLAALRRHRAVRGPAPGQDLRTRPLLDLPGRAGRRRVRLVASYEDPGIRNYVVDLARYPELRRALRDRRDGRSFADATRDRSLAGVLRAAAPAARGASRSPSFRSRGGASPIGAIFLRTFRDGPELLRSRSPVLPGRRQPHRQGAPQRAPFRAAAEARARTRPRRRREREQRRAASGSCAGSCWRSVPRRPPGDERALARRQYRPRSSGSSAWRQAVLSQEATAR